MKILCNDIDIVNKVTKLDHFHTYKNFPICMGCTTQPFENDFFIDFKYGISKSTGIIQIIEHPSDEDIYSQGVHNRAVGTVWNNLFKTMTKLIIKY